MNSELLDFLQQQLIVGKTIPFRQEGVHKGRNIDCFSKSCVAPIVLSSDKEPPLMALGREPRPDVEDYLRIITWGFEQFMEPDHHKLMNRVVISGTTPSEQNLVLGIGHKASGLITIDLDRVKVESGGITVGKSQRDAELTGLKNLREAIGDEATLTLLQAAVITFTPGGGMHWMYDATKEGCTMKFPVYSVTNAIQTPEFHEGVLNSDKTEKQKRQDLWREIINSEYYKPVQENLVNVAAFLRSIPAVDIRSPGGPGKCGEYTRAAYIEDIPEWLAHLTILPPRVDEDFRTNLQRLPAEFVGDYEQPKSTSKKKAKKDKEQEDYFCLEVFKEWLRYIPADEYDTCMRVALSMKKELPEDLWDDGLEVFDRWCSKVTSKYEQHEVIKLWNETSHMEGEQQVTGKTVRYLAEQRGWKPLFRPGADLGNDHVLILLMLMLPDKFIIVTNMQAYAENEPQGTGLLGSDNNNIWTFEAVDSSLSLASELLKRRIYQQHLINPNDNTTGGLARQIRTSLKWLYTGFTKRSLQAAAIAVESRARTSNWGDIINVPATFTPRSVDFSILDSDPKFMGTADGIWNLEHNRLATSEEQTEAVVTASTNRKYVSQHNRSAKELEKVGRLDDVLPEDARQFMWGEVSDIILRRARRRFYILIGEGGIGKTTWLHALRRSLGGYWDNLDPRAISASHEDTNITEFLRSFGRPFRATGISDKLPKRLSSETLKQVTGGDQMKIRGMRVASSTMDVTAVPILVCNDTAAPAIFVDDQGMRDRLHVIPFVPPEHVEDDNFIDTIIRSDLFADTYFSILMDRAHQRWKDYKHACVNRTLPLSVSNRRSEFISEGRGEDIQDFVSKVCVLSEADYTTPGDLWKAFAQYSGVEIPANQRQKVASITYREFFAAVCAEIGRKLIIERPVNLNGTGARPRAIKGLKLNKLEPQGGMTF